MWGRNLFSAIQPRLGYSCHINRTVDEDILGFCQCPEFSIRKKWNFCWLVVSHLQNVASLSLQQSWKLRVQIPAVGACGKAFCFPVRFYTGVWFSLPWAQSWTSRACARLQCPCSTAVGKAGQDNWIRCCYWFWLGRKVENMNCYKLKTKTLKAITLKCCMVLFQFQLVKTQTQKKKP